MITPPTRDLFGWQTKVRRLLVLAASVGLRSLDILGGLTSSAASINASRRVVGTIDFGNFGAFVTAPNGEHAKLLGDDLYIGNEGLDINSSGQVVGRIDGHAFITGANGVGLTDVNALLTESNPDSAWFDRAFASNDRGQFLASDGAYGHTYLFTPGPRARNSGSAACRPERRLQGRSATPTLPYVVRQPRLDGVVA